MSTRNYLWRRVLSLLLLIIITVNAPVGASSAVASESEDSVFETETLKIVNHFDYFTDSISPLSEKAMSKSEITKALAPYGKYLGTPGMPVYAYRDAMEQKWEDVTERDKKFTGVEIDLEKRYTYNSLVSIMKKLSRIDGVNLYKIGKSTQDRDMYAIEIDLPSDEEKDTIILTGTIHARETAGCTYILKELVDLLQDNSAKARKTLSRTRFVAVPCVNPDGREGVCYNPETYSYKKGELWKATTSGTDLNRNFPGLSWAQLKKGYEKSDYLSTSPDKLYYPGPFAGSAPETRAMMKFLYHYVVIEKAVMYIDYHQQGRIMYTEKPWCGSEQRKLSKDAANHFKEFLNKGQKKSSKNKYTAVKEDKDYGLNGVGSTMTDYACSIANGSKYSRAYGFNVYCTKTAEYPLIMIPRLDDTRKNLIEAPNPSLITFTFEIGWGKDSLGYSSKARALIADEYKTFHYDKVLFEMSDYAYGLRK
ncbi:MAG: hypothetical protein IJL07_02525 [Lachnospiraceae bacterium]|nr:hypothetical protein [Lachnospiraceae bacterium]